MRVIIVFEADDDDDDDSRVKGQPYGVSECYPLKYPWCPYPDPGRQSLGISRSGAALEKPCSAPLALVVCLFMRGIKS
jgi:hypothetical protein